MTKNTPIGIITGNNYNKGVLINDKYIIIN